MHARSLLCLGALLGFPATAGAQLRVKIGGGIAVSTVLLTDVINFEPIRVRPAIAPSFAVSLDGALDSVYRVGISLTVASSTLRGHMPTTTTDIVSLTVWEPAVRLGRYVGPLDIGIRAGLQLYRASRPVSIFQNGGEVTPAVGADIALIGPRIAGARLTLGAEWMVSRFSTTTLSLQRFSGEQTVQRFSIRVNVVGGPGAQ